MKYPFDEQKTPLSTARAWVMSNTHKGVDCPCCGQTAKRYRRTLHASMASALIKLYQFQKKRVSTSPFHAPSVLEGVSSRGGDFAKLVYWELLENDPEEKPGFYRVTGKGEEFVECRTAVASAVYLYNGKVIGWDMKDLITIVDALGEAYVYEKLMEKS